MDTPMDTPGPVQPTPAPTIYSNPVVNNDKPRLDEFPLLFESLGLPAREDWAYNMRHRAQQISDRFYLGSNDVARNQALLLEMGVTHVVAVRDVQGYAYVRERFPTRFTYKVIDIPDNPNTIFIKDVIETTRWMLDAIKSGGTVFVHCSTGISSSTLVATAYLMSAYNLDPYAAYAHVQGRRYCASLSPAFMAQLKEFEAILKAIIATQASAPPEAHVQTKRGMEEVDMSDDDDDAQQQRWEGRSRPAPHGFPREADM